MANVIVNDQTPKTVIVPRRTTRVVSGGKGPAARVLVGNRPHVDVHVNEDRTRVVKVGMQGPTGAHGADGEAGVGSISTGFSFSALPGPVTIGIVPAGRKIQSAVVKVISAFAPGTCITLGTDLAQGLLMVVTEASLQNIGMYEKTINLDLTESQEVKAFFSGSTSATGLGEITIFMA